MDHKKLQIDEPGGCEQTDNGEQGRKRQDFLSSDIQIGDQRKKNGKIVDRSEQRQRNAEDDGVSAGRDLFTVRKDRACERGTGIMLDGQIRRVHKPAETHQQEGGDDPPRNRSRSCVEGVF